ncbi:MAG TPA: VCBS repeat-containing protein [Pyrinomonadaceae bacterium]|nr:VCBS repeat-containing protein [Pyrinomonadaceae bacterium]
MTLKKRGLLLFLYILMSCSLVSTVFAQRLAPVVDIGGGGCVMGGVRGGRWIEAEEMAPLMRGGERYVVYSMMRRVGVRTGVKPASEGPPCTDTMYVKNMAPKEDEGGLIAVAGNWNALPRLPKVESNSSRVYREAVAEVLRKNGIRQPEVNIEKVLRVDLDGDGTDEVLINATRAKRWENGSITHDSNPGDYSVVLLRRVVKGKVQTVVVEGEYHPRGRVPETDGPPNVYAVTALLDLNGDGRLEIIVEGGYYEGGWKTVYSYRAGRVQNLFGCGCGA